LRNEFLSFVHESAPFFAPAHTLAWRCVQSVDGLEQQRQRRLPGLLCDRRKAESL
jgi:hypothetical protein